jgi:hypothetical protein
MKSHVRSNGHSSEEDFLTHFIDTDTKEGSLDA